MDEYISREAVLQTLQKANIGGYITERLLEIPSADVQPVKCGHWFEQDMHYVCSNCKHEFLNEILGIAIWENGVPYFCPWCGADMRGEPNE